ncbi:GNAT family N-acetyltransferase [Halobacteriales archaeon QS_1_68_20]|nr:MAG: GNAT family N-acetyltransferase [Halobacteriales archaeon QS_1_68_20]
MNVREVARDDVETIRDVADASLNASYDFLDEEVVDRAVDAWYGDEEMDDRLSDEDVLFLVAERDGEVAGFSQSHRFGQEGRIQWLHVDPDHRGEGVGSQLLDATRDALATRGVEQISGAVLADHEGGNEFYRTHGFSIGDQRTIDLGGEMVAENVYYECIGAETELEPVETPDREMYVDRSNPTRGKEGPFYPVYRSEDGSHRYGWFCSNCETVDNSEDTMGRIVCNVCENVHKADRWDASYL